MNPVRVITHDYKSGTPIKFRKLAGTRTYVCVRCGITFEDPGGTTLRCKPCRKSHKNEYERNWQRRAKRDRARKGSPK